jgi:hypothetical protein
VTPPRIYCLPAADAPIVAVIRRGPSDWCHLGRWDYENGTYEPGGWLRGVIYPQRCDLSPDGRWLCYFTLKKHADWPAGNAYVAISRLPWLTALAAWGIGSTWTRGAQFVADRSVWDWGEPDVGDASPCRERYGLAASRAASFAVERRRGWTETAGTPQRADDDAWDQRRDVTMEKQSPASDHRLTVTGWYAAHRELEPDRYGRPAYALDDGSSRRALDGVWWADWARDGRLIVATADGILQVREPDGLAVSWEQDLSALAPDPQPPPPSASTW